MPYQLTKGNEVQNETQVGKIDVLDVMLSAAARLTPSASNRAAKIGRDLEAAHNLVAELIAAASSGNRETNVFHDECLHFGPFQTVRLRAALSAIRSEGK